MNKEKFTYWDWIYWREIDFKYAIKMLNGRSIEELKAILEE